jgi:hypothetical protein
MEEAEFIKAIDKCIFQVLPTGTFWRCLFSVCLLVLFDCDDADTLETLALVIGLSSVGKQWALRANSFSLCIECFRGIEENARVHMPPRQNEASKFLYKVRVWMLFVCKILPRRLFCSAFCRKENERNLYLSSVDYHYCSRTQGNIHCLTLTFMVFKYVLHECNGLWKNIDYNIVRFMFCVLYVF